MKEHTTHTLAIQSLADVAQAVLDASPADLPPELLADLAQTLNRARSQLPPHLFYATVEQAPIAISITDPDANVLYVNPAFERVTGYARGEAVGCNESVLSDKCTPPYVYRNLWQTLVANGPWSGKLVNRRKNGERYLAELMIAPVRDEGGITRHYLGIHRDVTELHRLEQQVLNQKQRVETIVELAPMAIALLDDQGQIVLDNLAYKALGVEMGQEPARLLLRNDEWSSPGEGTAFVDREVSFGPENDGPRRWFSCSGTWIREMDERVSAFFARESRRYLLFVVQEITGLKQQQEDMRHNALRALIAEEGLVHGLREAIAAAEFQLQGPFNMLKAALGVLERRKDEHNGAVIDALRQSLAAGQQALKVLRGAMPRQPQEIPARLNLNQALRDVLSLVTDRMLALGIQVDWRPAPSLPSVIGCENRLRAMFKQLIDNALDAMDSPRVRCRELRLSTHLHGDVVQVTIEDTGPGIPDDLRLKVFEPFFSAKEGAGHAGMGLAMVREVVNRHHGALWLERGGEGGCRVQMQLPAREAGPSSGEKDTV